MAKVIILLGKPGAGKGTRLSAFLKDKEDRYEVLSVSGLLKVEIRNNTDIGKEAKAYMDSGRLVPDSIINQIVINKLKSSEKPIFTDGFPRTVKQAEAMLEAGISPHVVIEFYVDDDVVIQRAKDRIVCSKCGEPYTTNSFKPSKVEGICDKCGEALIRRSDDNPDVVRKRLKVYEEETYPVVDVLRSAGVTIHSIDNTSGKAGEELEKLLKNN